MSDYSENMDFSPSRQAEIAACEKLRNTVTGISALHKSLLNESLARSPSPRNSFIELYRMSTQAMAMKKEEMVSHRRKVFCNMDRAYVSLAPTPSKTRPPYKAVRPTTNKALPHFNSNSVHLISEP
ncbi:hypothetical protein TNIN_24831 [Trichonephila inaurata madagascariensis]|uniref:Uncharacterized protein n=1 Tax=Trichonephila inaurata madagascariensis TaxID=2747483 RepID=A0A8X6YR55_9ARAC|nr:hypothetical protein TNIN_24831 [Trichonephila inaurata madagascariensis]